MSECSGRLCRPLASCPLTLLRMRCKWRCFANCSRKCTWFRRKTLPIVQTRLQKNPPQEQTQSLFNLLGAFPLSFLSLFSLSVQPQGFFTSFFPPLCCCCVFLFLPSCLVAFIFTHVHTHAYIHTHARTHARSFVRSLVLAHSFA